MQKIRRRFVLLTLLLTLPLFSQASPALSFGWFCEGRICGSSPSYCCCDSLESATRDANCGSAFAPATAAPALCKAGCGCEQVIIAAHDTPDAAFSPVAAIPFPLLAEPPAGAFAPLQVIVLLTTAFRADSRGPPLRSTSLRFVSLRAPPFS